MRINGDGINMAQLVTKATGRLVTPLTKSPMRAASHEHMLSANRGLPAIGGERFLLSRVLAPIVKEPWRV